MSFFTAWQLPCAIVLLTGAEAYALWLYHRKTGAGISLPQFLPTMMAGNALLLALAVALAHGWGGWIAALLLASLVCHLTDLAQRWQRR
jgi:hypothetical protein